MRKSLSLAVAATAITSGAMLALAGPAGAATATITKAPTSLSMTASSARVVPGHKDVINGVLLSGTTPEATQRVYLDRYNATTKRWLPVAVGVTDTSGKAVFTFRPARTGDYRLVFRGTTTLAASHSAAGQIVVARLTTILTIAEAAPSVTAGSPDVISGMLTTGATPQVRRTIWLLRYDAVTGKWVLVTAAHANASGMVSFTVRPAATTTYRLAFHGTMTLAPSHSATATVTV